MLINRLANINVVSMNKQVNIQGNIQGNKQIMQGFILPPYEQKNGKIINNTTDKKTKKSINKNN